MASVDWEKTTERRDETHLSFGIWCDLYQRFDGNTMYNSPDIKTGGQTWYRLSWAFPCEMDLYINIAVNYDLPDVYFGFRWKRFQQVNVKIQIFSETLWLWHSFILLRMHNGVYPKFAHFLNEYSKINQKNISSNFCLGHIRQQTIQLFCRHWNFVRCYYFNRNPRS